MGTIKQATWSPRLDVCELKYTLLDDATDEAIATVEYVSGGVSGFYLVQKFAEGSEITEPKIKIGLFKSAVVRAESFAAGYVIRRR